MGNQLVYYATFKLEGKNTYVYVPLLEGTAAATIEVGGRGCPTENVIVNIDVCGV